MSTSPRYSNAGLGQKKRVMLVTRNQQLYPHLIPTFTKPRRAEISLFVRSAVWTTRFHFGQTMQSDREWWWSIYFIQVFLIYRGLQMERAAWWCQATEILRRFRLTKISLEAAHFPRMI